MANERDFEVDEVKESYRVAFTAEDVAAIQRFHIAPMVAMAVVWSLLAVILGVSVFTGKETSVASGILFGGALCIAVFSVSALVRTVRAEAGAKARMTSRVYEYDVYGDRVKARILCGEETVLEEVLLFSDIAQVKRNERFTFLTVRNRIWCLKNALLPADSVFRSLVAATPPPVSPKGWWKAGSVLLMIGSFVSVFAALAFCILRGDMGGVFDFRFGLLFLPIAVGSLVLAYFLRRRGYRYRKNVIAGGLAALLIVLMGFTPPIAMPRSLVYRAEDLIGTSLPEYRETKSEETEDTLLYEITFAEEEREEVERALAESGLFVSWEESVFRESFLRGSFEGCEYFLFLNCDTEEYNVSPEKNGTYRIFCIGYDRDTGALLLKEFGCVFSDGA